MNKNTRRKMFTIENVSYKKYMYICSLDVDFLNYCVLLCNKIILEYFLNLIIIS